MGKMKIVISVICLIALAVVVFSRGDEEFGTHSSNRTIAVVVTSLPQR